MTWGDVTVDCMALPILDEEGWAMFLFRYIGFVALCCWEEVEVAENVGPMVKGK